MDDEPPEPYKVGYCNPPLHRQFKPNESGNPSGRPKRQAKARSLHALLMETVTVTEDGKKTKLPLIDILHKKLIKKAFDGDLKAMSMILKIENAPPESNNYDDPDIPMVSRQAIVIKTVSARLRPKGQEHITPKKAPDTPENPEE